ncbi:SUMF1/EgtB/PvdO family nonheme iron enzyme [Chlamydiifrater volucris]|uniref:SUMF1/EgtB/PvdO family nonheme iron enzyme n=1 Tax=Chlamydiifrater volucris TaxID=2681470 RepID=UPI0032B27806
MVEVSSFQGEFLGDYRIIKRLGKDLWSESFLAEHRFIKKKYYLRVLSSEFLEQESFFGRFQELIVRLTALDHPGIIKIENVSSFEDRYFLVNAYEEDFGAFVTLTQYVFGSRTLIGESEVVAILEGIAEILDYAHNMGVNHGELHPDKIFLKKSGGKLQIFIQEFGFGELLREHFPRALFTCNFQETTARELYLAIAKDIAFRSSSYGSKDERKEDVHAFGALAYFLLSRKLPINRSMDFLEEQDYSYDWKRLFQVSFSEDSKEIVSLSSLILKKAPVSSALNIASGVVDQVEIKNVADEESIKVSSLVKEEVSEGVSLPDEVFNEVVKPEFVLVEAQSIDEAMDTSYGQESAEEDLSEGYTGILQAILSREPVVSQYKEKGRLPVEVEPLLTDMVLVEGGEFSRGSMSGSRDEQPVHKVVLDAFFMDIHPVTNEQFILFLEHCGNDKDKNCNDFIRFKESRIRRTAGKFVVEPGYFAHPVVGVTWYGAYYYAEWVGKRLPTEAEWEIAASAGLCVSYPNGNDLDKTQANFFSSDTTAVMSYPANPVGLYDMAGNVYEWCFDWYGYDYYEHSSQEPYAPKGPVQGVYRVLRGGCWKSLKEDLRVSHRHRNNPGTVNGTYGFRCAKDVR